EPVARRPALSNICPLIMLAGLVFLESSPASAYEPAPSTGASRVLVVTPQSVATALPAFRALSNEPGLSKAQRHLFSEVPLLPKKKVTKLTEADIRAMTNKVDDSAHFQT